MTALGRPLTFGCAAASMSGYDHGAHVVSWTPVEESEVLYLSPRARFDTGDAIRGGIPVIFPWFGPGPTGRMPSPHGFARTAQWHRADVQTSDSIATARWCLDSSSATSAEWPYSYAAILDVRAGRELTLELTVCNTGEIDFVFEEALHTYVRVSDIRRIRVDGLDGAAFTDKVADSSANDCVQVGSIEFTGETDRVYSSSADVLVHDPVLGRTIRVRKWGSQSTIVWNPWSRKAQGLADLPDDDWKHFVCVEGGNVREAAVSLAPGAKHVLGYSLSVEGFEGALELLSVAPVAQW